MQNTRIGLIISNIKRLIISKLQQIQNDTSKQKEVNVVMQRKQIGEIIIAVLTERIKVRQALSFFPKGLEDESSKAAWHALCHYEADEDIRKRDIEYHNEQVSFLEMIAFEFKDGNPLPQNITDSYKPFYGNDPISYNNGIKGMIKKLLRFLSI